MTQRIRVGFRPAVWLQPGENPFAAQLDLTREAERRGFDGVFFGDRLLAEVSEGDRDIYSSTHTDLMVTLTAMSALTERVQLGSLVMVLPFRHPVPLAKETASLDLLSGGRLILGVGSGWNESEFRAVGVPRTQRAGRMEETIALLRLLWSGRPVSFRGRYFALDEVVIEPAPTRPEGPPIWLGSFVPARRELDEIPPQLDRVLERIGRVADGWVPVPYSQLAKRSVAPAVLGQMWRRVRQHAQAAARPAPDLAFSHWYYVTESRADEEAARRALSAFFNGTYEQARSTYLIGSPEEIAEKVATLTSEVRDELAWTIWSTIRAEPRQLDLLCDKVLPLLDLAV